MTQTKKKAKCLICGCNYDPARYKSGCPDCQKHRMNEFFKGMNKP